MRKNVFKSQSGQVSRILIFIAVGCLAFVLVLYAVTTFISYQKAKNKKPPQQTQGQPAGPTYDTKAGNIRFLFETAEDMGGVLKAPHAYDTDLTTSDHFIKLTVGAQNLGKTNTPLYAWDVGDLIDSTGRHFTSINDKAYSWLPRPDLCGSVLKPQFSPVPCVKYYEVSRVSTSLRAQVKVTEPSKAESILDILVK